MSRNPPKKKQMTAEKKAELALVIKKKKECEARALRIVHLLLENPVDPKTLLENAFYISHSHYQDAIEERVINKNCGYPLCVNPLTEVPKQKYKIDTTSNKVYDITSRKNFCSAVCYKASNYFEEQLLTSPLWQRDKAPAATFTLLDPISKDGKHGNVVQFKEPQQFERTTSLDASKSSLEAQGTPPACEARLAAQINRMRLEDSRPRLPPARPVLPLPDAVERALSQWLCFDSFILLWGEERTASKAQEAGKCLPTKLAPHSGPKARSLDYSKVEAFIRGSMEYEVMEEEEATREANETVPIVIPIVEGKIGNQLPYRRRIVLDGLMKTLGELCGVLEIIPSTLTGDLRELVHTYQLTADTITFKPVEWNLISLFHLHVLRSRIPKLEEILCSSKAEKFTDMFLNNLHLSPGYLNQLMEKVWTTTLHK